MMENKCNKAPNNSKYLDHVYCQGDNTKANYIRSNNTASGNNGCSGGGGGASNLTMDMLAFRKENKQLKTMLLLHLDLLKEQSDEILLKDNKLDAAADEIEELKSKNAKLEAQVQELQLQLQRQLKRSALSNSDLTPLSPPPLAKIQCKKESCEASSSAIGECNGKVINKIILQRVKIGNDNKLKIERLSPHSSMLTSNSATDDANHADNQEENYEHNDEVEESDIIADEEIIVSQMEDSNDDASSVTEKLITRKSPVARGAKPLKTKLSLTKKSAAKEKKTIAKPSKVCVTPPTTSRGKQMPLMLWHASEAVSEESASSDSFPDTEHQASSVPLNEESKNDGSEFNQLLGLQQAGKRSRDEFKQLQPNSQNRQKRRCGFLSTKQEYCTREWEDEDATICDYEFSQAEADALYSEEPMLEIPKWTEHEPIAPSYCIEGTEDLSDETFQKRHSKWEVDEKRRKKWDVQQIREQRRIERLKRRHCKDELQVNADQPSIVSFFPQPENVETIYFTNELPVQAFGEVIPRIALPAANESSFSLPWLRQQPNTTTTRDEEDVSTNSVPSHITSSVEIMSQSDPVNKPNSSAQQQQQQLMKSTFVFLKKRKRQQSSSAAALLNSSGVVRESTVNTSSQKQKYLTTGAVGKAASPPNQSQNTASSTVEPSGDSNSTTATTTTTSSSATTTTTDSSSNATQPNATKISTASTAKNVSKPTSTSNENSEK